MTQQIDFFALSRNPQLMGVMSVMGAATAIIGVDADGSAYYFENAENLKQFKPGPKASGNKK